MPVSVYPPTITNVADASIPGATTVSSTSTEVLAANTSRRWCMLTNVGNKTVYLALGETAEVEKGFALFSNGGSLVLGGDFLSTEAINGVTANGTTKILTQEAIAL